jgi:hypothetical protein
MRFRDRKHQLAVQNAERSDPAAQELIAEFCELVNYPYQVQQNMFAVGFYNSVLPVAPVRVQPDTAEQLEAAGGIAAAATEVTPQEEIEAQIDPESTEAEILADEAATQAEAEGQGEELTAEIEEPTNDEAQGESETLGGDFGQPEATEAADETTDEETLAGEDVLPGDEPEAGEAFEPEATAGEEHAAEEASNGEAHEVVAEDEVQVEVEETAEGAPANEHPAEGDEEGDFTLSDEELAEMARELSEESGEPGSPNGRGRGPDPQSRM